MNRYLFVLTYMTADNLAGSSTVSIFSEYAKKIINRGNKVYWYLPQNSKNIDVVKYDLESFGVKVFMEDVSNINIYTNSLRLPSDLYKKFNRINGEYFVDAVVTTDSNSVMNIRNTIEYQTITECDSGVIYGAGGPLSVFVVDVFPKFPKSIVKEHPVLSDAYMLSQYQGYALADLVCFCGQNDADNILECAKDYLPFERIRKLNDKIVPFSVGVRTEQLKNYVDLNERKAEVFTKDNPMRVLSIGRLSLYSCNIEPLYDVFDMYKAGYAVNLFLSSPTALKNKSNYEHRDLFNFCNINTRNDRKRYFSLITNCHIGVVTDKFHNIPNALLEAQYIGLPMILPKYDWVTQFYPNDYPFFYKTRKECQILLRRAYDNYEDFAKWGKIAQKYIAENFSDALYDRTIDKFEEIIADNIKRYNGRLGSLRAFFNEYPKKVFSVDDMIKYIQKNSEQEVKIGREKEIGRTIGKGDLIVHLRKNKRFRDLGTDNPMTFEIVDD
jgi:hypothetical protein